MDNDNVRVVVSIDFGTTYSGFAYAHKINTEIITNDTWPDQIGINYKKAITDYLKCMGKLIKETIAARWPNVRFMEQVSIILTVPTGFSDQAKAIMRECIYEAGLINVKSSEKLQFITEPEAAAVYCMKVLKEHNLDTVGTNFLIVDCGNSTVDLTTWQEEFSSKVKNGNISVPSQPVAAILRGALEYVNIEESERNRRSSINWYIISSVINQSSSTAYKRPQITIRMRHILTVYPFLGVQIIHCKIGGSYNHWNDCMVTLKIMAFDPWPKQPTRSISCTYCSFDKATIEGSNAFRNSSIKHLPGLLITFMFGLSKTVSILAASSGEHVAVNASKGTEGKSCF
ncbi:unnamed protein product [Rhizophagus irregularis]|nr:unnamed protein product [Rhizophagus irregularis]